MKKNEFKQMVREEFHNVIKEAEEQRFVVTVEMYVYGRNEAEAKNEVNKILQTIERTYDNQPSMTAIIKQPFGKFVNTPVKI